MARSTIGQLIVNSPWKEPVRHWRCDRKTRPFELADGRRPAGHVVAPPDSKRFDDPGVFVEIPFVNQVRDRIEATGAELLFLPPYSPRNVETTWLPPAMIQPGGMTL